MEPRRTGGGGGATTTMILIDRRRSGDGTGGSTVNSSNTNNNHNHHHSSPQLQQQQQRRSSNNNNSHSNLHNSSSSNSKLNASCMVPASPQRRAKQRSMIGKGALMVATNTNTTTMAASGAPAAPAPVSVSLLPVTVTSSSSNGANHSVQGSAAAAAASGGGSTASSGIPPPALSARGRKRREQQQQQQQQQYQLDQSSYNPNNNNSNSNLNIHPTNTNTNHKNKEQQDLNSQQQQQPPRPTTSASRTPVATTVTNTTTTSSAISSSKRGRQYGRATTTTAANSSSSTSPLASRCAKTTVPSSSSAAAAAAQSSSSPAAAPTKLGGNNNNNNNSNNNEEEEDDIQEFYAPSPYQQKLQQQQQQQQQQQPPANNKGAGAGIGGIVAGHYHPTQPALKSYNPATASHTKLMATGSVGAGNFLGTTSSTNQSLAESTVVGGGNSQPMTAVMTTTTTSLVDQYHQHHQQQILQQQQQQLLSDNHQHKKIATTTAMQATHSHRPPLSANHAAAAANATAAARTGKSCILSQTRWRVEGVTAAGLKWIVVFDAISGHGKRLHIIKGIEDEEDWEIRELEQLRQQQRRSNRRGGKRTPGGSSGSGHAPLALQQQHRPRHSSNAGGAGAGRQVQQQGRLAKGKFAATSIQQQQQQPVLEKITEQQMEESGTEFHNSAVSEQQQLLQQAGDAKAMDNRPNNNYNNNANKSKPQPTTSPGLSKQQQQQQPPLPQQDPKSLRNINSTSKYPLATNISGTSTISSMTFENASGLDDAYNHMEESGVLTAVTESAHAGDSVSDDIMQYTHDAIVLSSPPKLPRQLRRHDASDRVSSGSTEQHTVGDSVVEDDTRQFREHLQMGGKYLPSQQPPLQQPPSENSSFQSLSILRQSSDLQSELANAGDSLNRDLMEFESQTQQQKQAYLLPYQQNAQPPGRSFTKVPLPQSPAVTASYLTDKILFRGMYSRPTSYYEQESSARSGKTELSCDSTLKDSAHISLSYIDDDDVLRKQPIESPYYKRHQPVFSSNLLVQEYAEDDDDDDSDSDSEEDGEVCLQEYDDSDDDNDDGSIDPMSGFVPRAATEEGHKGHYAESCASSDIANSFAVDSCIADPAHDDVHRKKGQKDDDDDEEEEDSLLEEDDTILNSFSNHDSTRRSNPTTEDSQGAAHRFHESFSRSLSSLPENRELEMSETDELETCIEKNEDDNEDLKKNDDDGYQSPPEVQTEMSKSNNTGDKRIPNNAVREKSPHTPTRSPASAGRNKGRIGRRTKSGSAAVTTLAAAAVASAGTAAAAASRKDLSAANSVGSVGARSADSKLSHRRGRKAVSHKTTSPGKDSDVSPTTGKGTNASDVNSSPESGKRDGLKNETGKAPVPQRGDKEDSAKVVEDDGEIIRFSQQSEVTNNSSTSSSESSESGYTFGMEYPYKQRNPVKPSSSFDGRRMSSSFVQLSVCSQQDGGIQVEEVESRHVRDLPVPPLMKLANGRASPAAKPVTAKKNSDDDDDDDDSDEDEDEKSITLQGDDDDDGSQGDEGSIAPEDVALSENEGDPSSPRKQQQQQQQQLAQQHAKIQALAEQVSELAKKTPRTRRRFLGLARRASADSTATPKKEDKDLEPRAPKRFFSFGNMSLSNMNTMANMSIALDDDDFSLYDED